MKVEKQYKVLHIFSGFGGGISSLILNLVSNKSENFIFDTMAFSYKNGEHFIEAVHKHGGESFTMPRPRIEGFQKFYSYVNEVIKNGKYDGIHCHIAGWMCLPFKIAASRTGVKTFIIHAHTTRYDSRIDRIPLINAIDKVINYYSATQYMQCGKLAGKYIFGNYFLNKKAVELIPNGIQKEKFLKEINNDEIERYNQEFNINDGVKIISHVGRFTIAKNHDFILDIANHIKNQKLDYVILLIGDGERFSEINEKAKNMNLNNQIRFLGRRNDISKILQYSDYVILPSINEGLPTVAIECQAAGTPILVSNTVTSECDMGLGLIEFISIDESSAWIKRIIEEKVNKLPIQYCLNHIESVGFTESTIGKKYCKTLETYIKQES